MTRDTISITCYGARGSLPAPSAGSRGFTTEVFGGNTSCYFVEAGRYKIILDCGSGIRNLGDDVLRGAVQAGSDYWIVLLSHYHWDHIQGLPFCVPFFMQKNHFYFAGFTPAGHEHGPRPVVESMLGHQQSTPHFPVAHRNMPAQKEYHDFSRQFSETVYFYYPDSGSTLCRWTGEGSPHSDALKVTTIPLNHPDGCLGYKIEYRGKSLVYATDNEPLLYPNANLVKHAQGVDWMLLDGQYTETQLAGYTQTFGHGSAEACVDQAKVCSPKALVIHHHDPACSDTELYAREAAAREYAIKEGLSCSVEFAREGQVWKL